MYHTPPILRLEAGSDLKKQLSIKQFAALSYYHDYDEICRYSYKQARKLIGLMIQSKNRSPRFKVSICQNGIYVKKIEPKASDLIDIPKIVLTK